VPRIKVSNTIGKFNSIDNFSVSVDHHSEVMIGSMKIAPHQLDAVKDWIILNHNHLHKIWHSETIDGQDHLDGIVKI